MYAILLCTYVAVRRQQKDLALCLQETWCKSDQDFPVIFSRLPVVLMFYMSHLYHCDKQYSIKGSVANAPANFKTVTWTIPFIRNQWFLKHDWIKLHYSQLPTTIIKITKRNIKRQKTAQKVPDSLDRRSTGDAAEKRSQHDKLHNITVLFARKFQYVSTDVRGLSLICR